jgi:hypothetical protein
MRLTATQLNALYNVAKSVNSLREFFEGVSGIRDLFTEIDLSGYPAVAWEIASKQTGQIYVSRHNPAEWDSGEFECRPLIYGD